jgi:YVTN family beta-propeller protein
VLAVAGPAAAPPAVTATIPVATIPVATIPVGTAPFGVAADALTGAVYVANTGSNTVSVISDQTNTVTDTVDAG